MLTARPLGAGKRGFDFVVGQRQAAGDGDHDSANRQQNIKYSSADGGVMSTDALAACGSAGSLRVRYVIRFNGAPYVFLVPAHEHPLEAAAGFFCGDHDHHHLQSPAGHPRTEQDDRNRPRRPGAGGGAGTDDG